MEYAAESGKQEIAEELLGWFLERKAFDCFAACLFQVRLCDNFQYNSEKCNECICFRANTVL